MQHFTATLTAVKGGGNFVVIPAEVSKAVGLQYGVRVRGTLNGVAYRSSLMPRSGEYCLGVHKATMEAAKVEPGHDVDIAIEIDDQPLPTDKIPPDLAAAFKASPKAKAAFAKLAPSHRREHVKSVLDAKKPETRARRIETMVKLLTATAPRSPARAASKRRASRKA